MKDLKHLIFFENLLQDAQNELVTQAVNDGKIALGYNCYYIPEVLLNLPGCFSSRLRAPRCESTDVATYYMTSRVCPYVRSILERAIEGGYNYLNALFGAECCASMERMEEHFFLINPVKNERFFVTQIDPPLKGDKTSYDYYKGQLKLKVVDQLAERYGVNIHYVTEVIEVTNGASTMSIYPPLGEKGANELGLTILCSLGDFDTLITGDMDAKTETKLVETYDLPDIEVLLVGHHGSKYSTGTTLLESVTPEAGVISVGDNSYGHPTEEALLRLMDAGMTVYRTDMQGNILITVD